VATYPCFGVSIRCGWSEHVLGQSSSQIGRPSDAKRARPRWRTGAVNIIYWQAPSILNPYLSGGTKDIESASLIIEPLARFNETANGALAGRGNPDRRKWRRRPRT
jgi:hypothetical protein